MATSNYGVVSVIQPPALKLIDQPSLIKFETEYAAYRNKVADVSKDRDEDKILQAASIKDCIDSTTLHASCLMKEIEGASTVEEATAEKTEQRRPSGGVANFMLSVLKHLDKNNASEILEDADMSKKFFDRLVGKFEPPVLRERIKMRRNGWKKSQLSDIKLFKDEVSALAVEISLTEVAQERVKPRGGSNSQTRSNVTSKKAKDSQQKESVPKKKAEKCGKRKNAEWSDSCLNPSCDGIHPLKECPKTSAERKKELFDLHYKEKEQKRVKTAKKLAHTGTPNADEGRFKILLEESLLEIALGDSGADFSAIGLSTFQKLKTRNPKILVTTMETPLKLEGAFKAEDGNTATTSSSTILSVKIFLPGSKIPVRIRGIEFLIINTDMDEVLLGRPFLQAIGFNLKDHLLVVYSFIDNKHVDDLEGRSSKLASTRYQGLSYESAEDDPIEEKESFSTGFGEDSEQSINEAFDVIWSNAKDNGISDSGLKRLRKLLGDHRPIFRIKLGSDPPAKVSPLVITPKEDAAPYRSPQRRYAPLHREFIVNTVKELEAVGALYKNPSARWASPALAVPKAGSSKLRFTVDLRGPNSRTIPIQSSMPHLESHFQDLSGSKCFANMDLAHGYWQVPLSPESQEMMSIQTPIGVYSSKRLLQGGSDSGNHFQAVLQEKFDGRVEGMIQWMDDFLLYSKSEDLLLDNIEMFFIVCGEIGLKIHAQKSNLFCNKVTFCGRIVTPEGIQYHPRHFDALVNMFSPTKATELQQFICATNWMRTSIPSYSERVAPLQKLLESIYRSTGKRTKRSLRNLSIENEWGAVHDSAFADIKNQLVSSVKLAHPKSSYKFCLFTDASDNHWAAILTQVKPDEQTMKIEEQNHDPLCFLSGAFNGSSYNWSVPGKEGFAIVEAMTKMDFLIMGHEISIFTDHANLVYIYDPYGQNPGIPRHTASKLTRWAIKLSAFRYVIEHLPGERNVWADMLTRWAVSRPRSVKVVKSIQSNPLLQAPISPSNNESLDWPKWKELLDAQSVSKEVPPNSFKHSAEGYKNANGVLWIPTGNAKLKLRIMIAAHTGNGGHRSWKVTLATIRAHFYWQNMSSEVESFVRSCLHCLCTETGKIVPRPLGHAMHAIEPNKLLHFDFCYMSPGENGMKYVLVLNDDHSGYVWLTPTGDTTAESAAEVLTRWFSTFGIVNQWVSDRGSHFKNELINLIRESTKSSHHFTLAYCPWSNGTVEVVCRELLKITRALLSEYQLPNSSWPSVLPVVQSALNNTILDRLGNRCPLTAFTGLPQDTPLSSFVRNKNGEVKLHSLNDIRSFQKQNISRLTSSLDNLHKEVSELSDKKRRSAVASHNRKTNVRPINFSEGDFVLKGSLQRDNKRKTSIKWNGPFRVLECRNEYLFVIENLISGSREEIHGRRLKFFRNKIFEISEEVLEHLSYQEGELLVIDSFLDIRNEKGNVELQVKWRGFADEEADWVQIDTLKEDVPDLLKEYISELVKGGTKRQRTIAASI